ncbi:hypothetical protein QN277_012088 [Acacia crassicarpa]|uniref:Peptidase A2 domain-containing protein n=1 Tax=Acacia crassicarpa TaxID=499986 RepID=A0AAE1N006_9FABA|nr:hypothetical protein QN277_012088 [Acacia crassicarpa]
MQSAPKSNGLMYVEAKLNGKPMKVMVDTGATHNVITPEEAKRVSLWVTQPQGGWLKTVNAPAKPLNGVATEVELCLGTWKGTLGLIVAPMDDFDVVFGMDFLRKAKAFLMPCYDSMYIMEKGLACTIPATSND